MVTPGVWPAATSPILLPAPPCSLDGIGGLTGSCEPEAGGGGVSSRSTAAQGRPQVREGAEAGRGPLPSPVVSLEVPPAFPAMATRNPAHPSFRSQLSGYSAYCSIKRPDRPDESLTPRVLAWLGAMPAAGNSRWRSARSGLGPMAASGRCAPRAGKLSAGSSEAARIIHGKGGERHAR